MILEYSYTLPTPCKVSEMYIYIGLQSSWIALYKTLH